MRFLTALLAASLPILATGQVQLLPAGEFAARDGRPGPGKTWRVTDARGTELAARLNAVIARTPVVIDYEHQTLNAAQNGRPAPAAGWMKLTAWRDGEGLFAEVEWTAAAKAAIAAGEYRYISPVIQFDGAGNVTGVLMAALTNFPALLGMDAAVAQLNTQLNPPETDMALLVALLTAIGLPATTTEADALAAVSALKATVDASKAKPTVPVALTAALGLAASADEAAAVQAVATLKAGDTGLVGLVTALQGQVATLTASQAEAGLVATVEAALAANKFPSAMRDQLLAMGRKDAAMLNGLVAAAQPIPGLNGQSKEAGTEGAAGGAGGGSAALTAQQKEIAKCLGLDPKAYQAHLVATAAAA